MEKRLPGRAGRVIQIEKPQTHKVTKVHPDISKWFAFSHSWRVYVPRRPEGFLWAGPGRSLSRSSSHSKDLKISNFMSIRLSKSLRASMLHPRPAPETTGPDHPQTVRRWAVLVLVSCYTVKRKNSTVQSPYRALYPIQQREFKGQRHNLSLQDASALPCLCFRLLWSPGLPGRNPT